MTAAGWSGTGAVTRGAGRVVEPPGDDPRAADGAVVAAGDLAESVESIRFVLGMGVAARGTILHAKTPSSCVRFRVRKANWFSTPHNFA